MKKVMGIYHHLFHSGILAKAVYASGKALLSTMANVVIFYFSFNRSLTR